MYKKICSYIGSQSAEYKKGLQIFDFLNQTIPVLIGIFIFLNPFPHTTTIKEICFYLSSLIVLILVLFKKTEFSFKAPLSLPLGLFVFWSFLSVFFALDKENSIHDFYSHLIRYLILYFILTNYFTTKKRLVSLSWVIVISATVFSIGGLFSEYLISGNELSERFALRSSQAPANTISIITAFAIVLSLNLFLTEMHLYRKLLLIFCLFPLFAVTLFAQSRGTFVAMALAFVILFIRNKQALIAILFLLPILVAITPIKNRFILVDNILHNDRINQNYISFKIVKDYPIIGTGFGMKIYGDKLAKEYHARLPAKYKLDYFFPDPHNMFFSVAVRLGLVGLVSFLYILFVAIKMAWKITKHTTDDFLKNWGLCTLSLIGMLLLAGFFESNFTHLTEVVLFVTFSLITILWRLDENISPSIATPFDKVRRRT